MSKLDRLSPKNSSKPGPDVVELGEDEAAIVVHVLHRGHALGGVALLQAGVLVALAQRDGEQRAVGPEAPGVIRTAEELAGIAAGLGGDARALVRAAIVENLHRVVGVAHHQDRLRADGGAEIVAGICHLAVMADIDPGIGEDMLHLELEHLLVDVDVAMDLGLADQPFDRFEVSTVLGHQRLLTEDQRSSTRRGVFDREMQICIILPLAFSASDRM